MNYDYHDHYYFAGGNCPCEAVNPAADLPEAVNAQEEEWL